MAQIDRAHHRLEMKLVYWGPAFGGKTTSLRSLHGRCRAGDRGELTSIETEEERTYFFDYAPLELPRFRGLELRLHAYTVPGQDVYVNTRLRILKGASAVVFVADASPSAQAANDSSWRQLDAALRSLETADRPMPVVVAANKQDLPGAARAGQIVERLRAAAPARAIHAVHETSALSGVGVVGCFRDALLAAVDQTVPAAPGPDDGERAKFLEGLAERLGRHGDGVAMADAPARRQVRVEASSGGGEDDGGGLSSALATNALLAARDHEVREMQREHAFGRLLVDLGHLCLAASGVEPMVRSVLATLVMNLDGVGGWVGLTAGGAEQTVYDTRGVCAEAGPMARAVRPLLAGAAEDRPVVLDRRASEAFPGGAAGGRGILLPFSGAGGSRGWLLLVGTPEGSLPENAEAVLVTTGAFLGLSLARLAVLRQVQDANLELERRVADRTHELVEEKAKLEIRVRERTHELEEAKRATVEAERGLLDRERTEGVRQLAAGLAHELNNPIGAVQANLEFVSEGLERLPGLPPGLHAEVADLASAVRDARTDVERVSASVRSLFDDATSSRRAAQRTPLAPVVRDTLDAYVAATRSAHPPRLVERDGVLIGVQPAECSRWLFRVLTLLAQGGDVPLELEISSSSEGPCLAIVAKESPLGDPETALSLIVAELARCGGRLAISDSAPGVRVQFTYPRALGESRVAAGAPARTVR